ncbi:MAG: FHA domain-containing protein [Bdellovibrionota bacterium]
MKVTFTFQDGLIQSYPLKLKTFVIGRSNKCHVCVNSSELSREHCRVDIVGNNIYLTDMDSSNGVFVDNVQLAANKKTKYSTNQQLHMGDCYVVFDLSSAELTRSMVNIRPLLENEGQTQVRKMKVGKKQMAQEKKEKFSSSFLTLVAWGLLLTGTFILANIAFAT